MEDTSWSGVLPAADRHQPRSANILRITDPFKVRFVWLGTVGTTPGSQPVTIYNADFSTQSQGQTTNVPEPSSLALLFATANLLAARPRNSVFPKRRHPRSGHLPFEPSQTQSAP